MPDTSIPTSVRIWTHDTPDGRTLSVQLQPNGIGPEVGSPLAGSAVPLFDMTVPLPTETH